MQAHTHVQNSFKSERGRYKTSHTCTHTCWAHSHAHTNCCHARTRTHAFCHTHTHTHMNAHTYTCYHTHVHAHACRLTHACCHTHMNAHTDTHAHPEEGGMKVDQATLCTHTCYTHAHMHERTHARTHACCHTHARAHPQTRTHRHARRRTSGEGGMEVVGPVERLRRPDVSCDEPQSAAERKQNTVRRWWASWAGARVGRRT